MTITKLSSLGVVENTYHFLADCEKDCKNNVGGGDDPKKSKNAYYIDHLHMTSQNWLIGTTRSNNWPDGNQAKQENVINAVIVFKVQTVGISGISTGTFRAIELKRDDIGKSSQVTAVYPELDGSNMHLLINRFGKSPDGLYYVKVNIDDTNDGHKINAHRVGEADFFFQSVFTSIPDAVVPWPPG